MHLDLITLMAGGSFVAALSGLLLLAAWSQMPDATALLWWSAAAFASSVSIGLFTYGTVSESTAALLLGTGLGCVSPALTWGGVRKFVHRPISISLLGVGPAVWLVTTTISLFGLPPTGPIVVGFAMWIAYLLSASWDLLRMPDERLMARGPLVVLFSLHALIFLGGLFDVLVKGETVDTPTLNSWFGLINFEYVVYSMGAALFLVLICKQRSEARHIEAGKIDALTGIANRGAFFDGASQLVTKCREAGEPVCVIVFDLDRFKTINDTYGHGVGDRVLALFARSAQHALRSCDFFGRHGGEEFAVVLPNATLELALATAERVRHAFAASCGEIDGRALFATVSAGVAAISPSVTLGYAFEAADRALYRAKSRGRNRVERANDWAATRAAIRVA